MNHLRNHRKGLRRIDWKTANKLMSNLYNRGRMKKTLLATSCSMGYDKCRLYIDWLEMMELVKKETTEDGHVELDLTEKGRLLYSKISNMENFGSYKEIEDL